MKASSLNLIRRELKARFKKKWQAQRCPTYRNELSGKHFSTLVCRASALERTSDSESFYLEKVLKHEFDLLGSSWVSWTKAQNPTVNQSNQAYSEKVRAHISSDYLPIDWQLDPKSGFRWSELDWHKDIRIGKAYGVDIKLPWEIGRLQHLIPLAKASLEDSNKDCAREVENQLLDFVASNPPGHGAQWACTMDVAIRAANMAIASSFSSDQLGESVKKIIANSLADHIHFIVENLEWHPKLRVNHYFANICGLLVASTCLEDYRYADRCLAFAALELHREAKLQFHEDGSNFEASTAYHRLVFEMLLVSIIVLQSVSKERVRRLKALSPREADIGIKAPATWSQFDIPFDSLISQSLYELANRARSFLEFSSQPNTEHLNIGDNDSGRFVCAYPQFIGGRLWQASTVETLELATLLFEPEKSAHCFKSFLAEHSCPFKMSRIRISESPDFGLYSLESGDLRLWLRAGPLGQRGNGGHAHNDQLAICLSSQDTPIIVDPGSGLYTSDHEIRNSFRSTKSHNSLALGAKEQNEILAGAEGLFKLKERTFSRVDTVSSTEIRARHFGFKSEHLRKLCRTTGGFDLIDECRAEGSKTIFFHFYPSLEVRSEGLRAFVYKSERLLLCLHFESSNIKVQDYEYSRDYGRFEPAKKIAVQFSEHSHRTQLEAAAE